MNPTKITMMVVLMTLSAWMGCGDFGQEMQELEVAAAAVTEGQVDPGRDSLELVATSYPGTVEAALSLHGQGLIAGEYDDDPYTAVELIQQAQESLLNPDLPPVLIERMQVRMTFDLAIYLAQKGDCEGAVQHFNSVRERALESIVDPVSFVNGHIAAGDCAGTFADYESAAHWYGDGLDGMDESLIGIYAIALEMKLSRAAAALKGPQGGVNSLESAWLNTAYQPDEKRPLIKLEQVKFYGELGDVQSQIQACHAALGAVDGLLSDNEGNPQLFLFLAPFSIRALEELENHYTFVGLKEQAEAAHQARMNMLAEIEELMSGG
jgi:hypothetical protein